MEAVKNIVIKEKFIGIGKFEKGSTDVYFISDTNDNVYYVGRLGWSDEPNMDTINIWYKLKDGGSYRIKVDSKMRIIFIEVI